MTENLTIAGAAAAALVAVAAFFRAVLLKVLEHFINALDAYRGLVANHISHQTSVSAQQTVALERLAEAIERLERRLAESSPKG
jgi:hypothetical protein